MNPISLIQQTADIWNNKSSQKSPKGFENDLSRTFQFWGNSEEKDLNCNSTQISPLKCDYNNKYNVDKHTTLNHPIKTFESGSKKKYNQTQYKDIFEQIEDEDQQFSECKMEPLRPKSSSIKIKKSASTISSNSSSKRGKFTPEEDQLLLQKINQMGKVWKEICKFFENKTPNMIRNRYYTKLRNQIKKQNSTDNEQQLAVSTKNIENETSLKDRMMKQKLKIDEFSHDDSSQFFGNDENTSIQYQDTTISNIPSCDIRKSLVLQQQQQQQLSLQFQYLDLINKEEKQQPKTKKKQANIKCSFLDEINDNNSDFLAPMKEEFQNNNEIAKILQQEEQESFLNHKGEDIFEDPKIQNNNFFAQNNIERNQQNQEEDFLFDSNHSVISGDQFTSFNNDDLSLADEAAEMPQYKEAQKKHYQQQEKKQSKIQHLQIQLQHIESLIKSCRNEIFNEIQQKQMDSDLLLTNKKQKQIPNYDQIHIVNLPKKQQKRFEQNEQFQQQQQFSQQPINKQQQIFSDSINFQGREYNHQNESLF